LSSSEVVTKLEDSNLVLLYKEILGLRSAVDSLEGRVLELERTIQELSRLQKHKKRDRISLSPLQRKVVGFLGEGAKTQNEICETLNAPQSSISHSLSKLEKELNIVETRPTTKAGARFEYALKRNLPEDILDLLAQL